MPTDPSTNQNNGLAANSLALRRGEITCEQIVADSLAAIARTHGELGAFTFVAADQAIAEARAIDATKTTRFSANILTGVPVAVKEVIAVDDMPTTAGTKMDVSDLTPLQGPFIRRLRGAGAIVVGKTVSTEFALSYQTLSLPTPHNPCFPGKAYTPGGSSSGSAVAVAAGLCPIAIGTDTGGSIRIPAAFCGVTGFKPTTGYWPREGMFPLSRELDTIGVLTRTPSDLMMLLEALGGVAVPRGALGSFRLGIPEVPFYDTLDPAIAARMNAALRQLSKAGAVMTKIVMPDLSPLISFATVVNSTALVRFLGRERVEKNMEIVDPVTRLRFQSGLKADVIEIQRLLETRRSLASRINSNLAHIDALIMPTTPGLPVEIASFTDPAAVVEWQTKTSRNVRFANLFDMAAISIPLPGPQPIGMQLVAPAGNELKLAGIAATVHQALEAGV